MLLAMLVAAQMTSSGKTWPSLALNQKEYGGVGPWMARSFKNILLNLFEHFLFPYIKERHVIKDTGKEA